MFCQKCGAQNADDAQTCAACGAEMAQFSQPSQPAQPTVIPMAAAPRTSPMAIWSLILGIVGLITCGLASIAGIILGILGLKQTKERPAEFGGGGLAVAGLVVSCITLFAGVILMLALILFPVFARARDAAKAANCQSNVKQISMAMKFYLSDWNDTYPPAENWCDAMDKYTMAPKIYVCPSVPEKLCGYGFNDVLAGQPEGIIKDVSATVTIFESDEGWNAHGRSDAMITLPRHSRGFTTGFADGHVMSVSPGSESDLSWSP